ncbi:DNA polymerase [Photobacterium sp. OFAV2-7]|uniref:DNA polymerase n=1 Tax=Photobacterium sp. OFAV2-7 TaxID=2917748 RepID=UPI001EF5A3A6|nr:DNA polymerase [Photobacterium sp. OFAV2-7]MCG7584947.1 DNA polymerase [Photobacterium sp. OFAV2-7]
MEESLSVWADELSTVVEEAIEVGQEIDESLMGVWGEASNDFDLESTKSISDVVMETMPLVEHLPRKEKAKGKKGRHFARTKFYDRPVIAFDTEYVLSKCGKYNRVLSYQFVVRYNEKTSKLVLYPDSTKKSGRLALDYCLARVIEKAKDDSVLDRWPTDVIVTAHFMKADLFNFNQAFDQIKTHIKGIRKTVASLGDAYALDLSKVLTRRIDEEPVDVYDKHRNKHTLHISFYDTMLLAPAGKSLADVGELVGLPKLVIPEPYSIERMSEYLAGDKEGFEAYGLRDAEVSALHFEMTANLCKEMGLKSVPYTIGGMAVKAFINSLDDPKNYRQLFGFEEKTFEVWSKDKSKIRTVTVEEPTKARSTMEWFAAECYSGGRNEAFWASATHVDTWNDLDVPSCYAAITNALRPIAYERMYMSTRVEDFFGDKMALAWVEFEFPPETRYPSLVVRSKDSLIFPLSGETHCTGNELEVAYNQGAKIKIKQGFIFPWESDERIFEKYMRWGRQKRKSYPKNSFQEKLIKEMLNSTYGKFSQNVKPKKTFSVADGYSKPQQPSKLTNPYYAAYTCGMARALLGEMLVGVPEDKVVISVTTDGFLTNASIDEIDLSGPVCQRFRDLFHRMEPNGGEILEIKHKAKQLICAKTRAQFTVIPMDGWEPVLAKGGVRPPKGEKDHNSYMVELYKERTPEHTVDSSHLTSLRVMSVERQDMLMENKKSRLNLEFDMKRELVKPRMIDIQSQPHVSFETKPFHNEYEMRYTRIRFDAWRKNRCLKTIDDWYDWQERLSMYKAKKDCDVRLKKDEKADELMARLFVRFYGHEESGISKKDITAKALSEWLVDLGYDVKPSLVRGAGRAKLVKGAIPLTHSTLKLAKRLADKFPQFDPVPLFAADDVDELQLALKQ